jgi:hypothetical protein
MLPGMNRHKVRPVTRESSRTQAEIHARLGAAALQRYVTGPADRADAEYATAMRELNLALSCLEAGDPMRANVSFDLGATRLAAHMRRCGKPCTAAAEFRQIVEQIAVGGARPDAPARQLSLYATVLDQLYDHTGDPADIDVAIDWLRRAAADRRLPEAERRRMLVGLAVQHANRGEALRAAQRRSGPGTDSWAAFETAIGLFDEVLASVDRRGDRRGDRRDGDRPADRLDAWLGQLETYYQRGGDAARDDDLDRMAAAARSLIGEMTPGYHVRTFALGRAGTALIQRIARLLGEPWDLALNSMVLSGRPDAITPAFGRVPGFGPDLELAIGALAQAVALTDPADQRHPAYTAALFSAHCLRYLAMRADRDLAEIGRLGRAVLGHPLASSGYRRQCGEWLLLVLLWRVAGPDAAQAPGPLAGWPRPSPSADGDLDTMLGLLAGFAADDGERLAVALSALFTDSVLTRAEGNLSDAELRAQYARARAAAAGLAGVPAAHAVLLLRAAEIGVQLVYRGAGREALAQEVAAAFRAARAGLPASHPLAAQAAASAAAFETAMRSPRDPAAGRPEPVGSEGNSDHVPHVPGAGSRPGNDPGGLTSPASARSGDDVPPVLDAFSMRALAAPGVGSQDLLAGTPGASAEAVAGLLARQPPGTARAAVRSVLAVARYGLWLRERTGEGLGGSLDDLRVAITELPAGHPLHARLTLLLARMLLDRAQLGGDLADADAALRLLDGLRAQAAAFPPPASLPVLLAAAGPPGLSELLAAAPAGEAGFLLDLDAADGTGRLLRGLLALGMPGLAGEAPGGDGGADLGAAVGTLRRVAGALPATDPRRPDVLSDLGLALCAAGHAVTAAEVLREAAAAAVPGGHPRQAAILLRAAAALAAAERDAARAAAMGEEDAGRRTGAGPHAPDAGTSLLTQALSGAGLTASGERSRCLYGLGAVLLLRYHRTGQAAALGDAIARLEEARAGVESVPGDPFLVPLLRALAWAHRQDAYRLGHADAAAPGHPYPAADTDPPRLPLHRSRSAGRSVLYAHAQAVLLQSGSRHALAASRAIGRDALTLAEWCIADGRPDSAVEALELGRALVLHAATVAADVPALLREAGRRDLAAAWDRETSAARGGGLDIDAVPGDLRGRVLAALRTGTADRRLLAAPSVTDIASALRAAGLDALVYLMPAAGAVRGRAVIVGADETAEECPLPGLTAGPGSAPDRLARADQDFRATRHPAADPPAGTATQRFATELNGVCDWAWTTAIGPLLRHLANVGLAADAALGRPPRLALVPIGLLGIVPWHAARRETDGEARYASADAIFTTCASARQLIDAASRRRLAPGAAPAVFVANPDGTLPGSALEADAICAALYRDAVYLGQSERTAAGGLGTPDEVLSYLPGAGRGAVRPAVLHLGCHASAGESPERSRLELAAGAVLPVSRILAQARRRERDAPGSLVVLAACTSDRTLTDHDEALTLASAFLAAGAAGAVGSRWAVNDRFTALLMFMFHRYLLRSPGDGTAAALRAAQLWMLDQDRAIPPDMPGELASIAALAIHRPYAWAAFTCHGL